MVIIGQAGRQYNSIVFRVTCETLVAISIDKQLHTTLSFIQLRWMVVIIMIKPLQLAHPINNLL